MSSFLCLVLWVILLLLGLFVLAAVILWCETFQTKQSAAASQAATPVESKTGGVPAAVTLPALAVARPFAENDPASAVTFPPAVTLEPTAVARPFADNAKPAAKVAPPAAVHLDPVEVPRPFAKGDGNG